VVAVTNRVQLAVRVPVDDVERYESYLRENYVQKHPYAGTELERELRTLREDNDLAALGDEIDRVLQAAGRRPTDDREKNILTRSVSDGPTKPVNYRIDPDVREWFVHTYDEPGRVAGRLMRYIADGGTLTRLLRRFQRVADDAEALLADLADGVGSVGPKERRTRTLCRLLTDDGDGFEREHFRAALDSPEVEGIGDTDHTRETYLPRVLDRLNHLPHPNKPDLFLPESQSRNSGADPNGPAIDLWAPEDVDDDKLIRGLRIELARDAASGNGRVGYTTAEVQVDVFDGRLSTQKVASVMESAATADGFKTKSDGGKRITVYLPNVDDRDVLEHVDTDESGRSSSTSAAEPHGSTSEDTVDDGTDDAVDVEAEAEAKMNQIAAATPATDGGEPVDGEQ